MNEDTLSILLIVYSHAIIKEEIAQMQCVTVFSQYNNMYIQFTVVKGVSTKLTCSNKVTALFYLCQKFHVITSGILINMH